MVTGFADTNWSGIDAVLHSDIDPMVTVSVPTKSGDTGLTFGAYSSWDWNRHLGLSFTYQHLPDTTIQFKPGDIDNTYPKIASQNYRFTSSTETMVITLRVFAPIFDNSCRLFADAGGGATYRHDILSHKIAPTATFGAGIQEIVHKNLEADLTYHYITGHADANITPANDYIPYVNSLTFSMGYRF